MAHHEAISKARWLRAQKYETQYWHGREALKQGLKRVQACYLPVVQRYAENLPGNAAILEIGCGPNSTAQFIARGNKTYVDPLLDDFRRAYPGELPKGEYLCQGAESIGRPDGSFDLVLAFDALDHAMNPELVLNEIERLLKPGGIFIMSIFTSRPWLARLHYYLDRCLPALRNDCHPYVYSRQGIENTLRRHFDIVETCEIDPAYTPLNRQGWIFVCKARAEV